jgi:hypothetical protein
VDGLLELSLPLRTDPGAEGAMSLSSWKGDNAVDPITLVIAFVVGFVFFGLLGKASRKRK